MPSRRSPAFASRPKIVAPMGAHECDPSPGPRRRHRLIRSLPARMPGKLTAELRLTRSREMGALHDEIRIGTADHDDSGAAFGFHGKD